MAIGARLISGVVAVVATALLLASPGLTQQAPEPPPPPEYPWAYPVLPAGFVNPPDPDGPQTVPNGSATHTWAEVRDLFKAVDWFPEEHPPFPLGVGEGRRPDPRACAVCHRALGTGGPENASLAGLPYDYIVQQMEDFRTGAREGAHPTRSATMIAVAKAASDAEIHAAAEYFSSLKPLKLYEVIETDMVPLTEVRRGSVNAAIEPEVLEPIGVRIIDVPVNFDQFEKRDPHATFIAYVPKGSIARGEDIVTTGAGITTACEVCHGNGMRGLGPVPGIAGRSPSTLFRALYDMQQGARHGVWTELMAPIAAALNEEDTVAVLAYLATLDP